MRVYRIAPKRRSGDLTGSGARMFGGRWNPKGLSMLYTSATAALAVLEVLVHVDWTAMIDYALVEIEVNDTQVQDLNAFLGDRPLPANWHIYPAPSELAEIGKQWLLSMTSTALLVPSSLFPAGPESNILLNPAHPRYGHDVDLVRSIDFKYDDRLKK